MTLHTAWTVLFAWGFSLLAACARVDGGIDLDILFADAGAADDDGDGGDTLDAGDSPDAGDGRVGCEPPASEALVDPRGVETACVVDRWLAELPGLPSSTQYQRVKAAIDDASLASSFPLRTGARVVFVAEVVAGERPALVGEFNGWDPALGEMQPLAQSGFAYREERLDERRHAYAFTYGVGTPEERQVVDPAARWLVPSGDRDAFHALAIVGRAPLGEGLLRWRPRFPSVELGAPRDVFVWLPATTFSGARDLPTIYAHDGRQVLTLARADLALSERGAAGKPLVLGLFVDVPPAARRDDYTSGTATGRAHRTARFFAETLAPWVDAHFPTRAAAGSRAVTGSSLGGLQALYAGWNHTATFGLVGSQSGSFFWPEPDEEALTREIEAAPVRPLRIYLDNGRPNDNERWNEHLAAVLEARGYDHVHVQVQGAGHDWADWGARWPGMLDWLFPAP